MRVSFLIPVAFLLFSCTEEEKKEKKKHLEFYLMDSIEGMELKTYKIKRKKKSPYFNNLIYDPFIHKHAKEAANKTSFTYKKGGLAHIKFLPKRTSYIDVSPRKTREPMLRKAYPIIIENISKKDTLYIKLFRGKLLIFQEALSKKQEWKPIEYATKEKMGYYYYKIFPNEYIYTKIPVYEGDYKTTLRAKVFLNDSTVFTTKNFNGSIPKRLAR